MNTDSMVLHEGEEPKIKLYEQMINEMTKVLAPIDDKTKNQALEIIFSVDTAEGLVQHIGNPIIAQFISILTYNVTDDKGKIHFIPYSESRQAFSDVRAKLWSEKKAKKDTKIMGNGFAHAITKTLGLE